VAKKIKYIITIILFLAVTITIVNANTEQFNKEFNQDYNNYPYIDDMYLNSSVFTRDEKINENRLNNYLDNYQVKYTTEELETLGFEKVIENTTFDLYLEEVSFSILLYDKINDFFWSSRPEHQELGDANLRNRNLMNSGITIEFNDLRNPENVRRESLLTIGDALYFDNDENIAEHLRPYAIDKDSIITSNFDVKYTIINNVLKAEFNIKSYTALSLVNYIGFKFDVYVTLTEDSIEVEIPHESIIEGSENFRLMSIAVFQFFGSTKQDKTPGYFVIPDNIGALIRLDNRINTTIPDMPFYGNDFAYSTTMSRPNLKLPIFGVVHLSGHQGFYVEIEKGASTSVLQTVLWSQNTEFQRINAKYAVRQVYRTIVNRQGDGSIATHPQRVEEDYLASYKFLSGEDASYVGIAKDYRDKLIKRGVLTNREQTNDNNIPINTSIILSDQEKAFLGTKKVTMTTLEQAKEIYNDLYNSGLTNQHITLYGWSKDGYLNKAPYKLSYVEGKNKFRDFTSLVQEDNNKVFVENNYVLTNNSRKVNNNRDIARSLAKVRITFTARTLNENITTYRLIDPKRSLEIAKNDLKGLNDLGFDGASLKSIGSMLFSNLDGNTIVNRSNAIEQYQTLIGLYNYSQVNNPNSYLWENLDSYSQMEISNYQYNHYTDLVPLIPIMLKGSISYFGTNLNFNVSGQRHLLQMIDFGINPSYIYTYEDTYKMRYTEASSFFTTKFDDFQDETINNYNFINNALSHVINAKIENREVIQTGFVKVSYSNGVDIYINYTDYNVVHEGHTILPQNYKVVSL